MIKAKDCYDGGSCRNEELIENLTAQHDMLLKACRMAFTLFQEQVEILCGAGFTSSEHDNAVMTQLRTAIAQAEGESNDQDI